MDNKEVRMKILNFLSLQKTDTHLPIDLLKKGLDIENAIIANNPYVTSISSGIIVEALKSSLGGK